MPLYRQCCGGERMENGMRSPNDIMLRVTIGLSRDGRITAAYSKDEDVDIKLLKIMATGMLLHAVALLPDADLRIEK